MPNTPIPFDEKFDYCNLNFFFQNEYLQSGAWCTCFRKISRLMLCLIFFENLTCLLQVKMWRPKSLGRAIKIVISFNLELLDEVSNFQPLCLGALTNSRGVGIVSSPEPKAHR